MPSPQWVFPEDRLYVATRRQRDKNPDLNRIYLRILAETPEKFQCRPYPEGMHPDFWLPLDGILALEAVCRRGDRKLLRRDLRHLAGKRLEVVVPLRDECTPDDLVLRDERTGERFVIPKKYRRQFRIIEGNGGLQKKQGY